MSREGVMITKLKEGLQEALVFLRQLGDFKIPAVMERRRKGLLDKLLELQGDTFRGDSAPKDNRPTREPSPEKLKSPEPEKEEKQKEEEEPVRSTVTSPSRDSITSPSKRLSRGDSKISALVGNYEHITTLAKKEEEAETPKRFVQLKKVAKPSDFPDTEKDKAKEEAEEPPKEQENEKLKPQEVEKVAEKTSLTPQPSPLLRRKEKENGGLKAERPSSTVSEESANTEAAEEEQPEEEGEDPDVGEKESGKKKGKFGRFKKIGKLGDKLKKKHKSGRDKSPSRAVEDEDEKSMASEGEEGDHNEETSAPEQEEGVKISGMLERKVTSRFKSKWVKVSVKLKDNVLHIGDKERVELAGCTVSASDAGFDVINTATQQKQIQFRMEEGENGKERWIEALSAAIEECTPEQEEPSEEPAAADSSLDVPNITVEQPPSPVAPHTPSHEDTPTLKKKRESKALSVSKPAQKLPEQGVEMKGYMYRKKPGLGTRWEKTYCVLTYQAIYFSTKQGNSEYNHMLSLMGDAQKTLSEKKGHDKNSKGINLKLGSKKEQLSFDTSDFDQWKSALEKVLGIGGVEELLSEDEDIEEDIGGGILEELYEELETEDLPPPIPSSPRPATTPVPADEPDDFIIDEDIYEDTDDYRQDFDIQESPVHTAPPPALPDRNPPKMNTAPPPALPDRNPPKPTIAAPSLPPRNAPAKSTGPTLPPREAKQEPQQYEQSPPTRPPAKLPAKAPAKMPPPAPGPDVGGEEIYDDVIPGGADDQDAEIEETYDDVIVGENDVMEETYDDVVSVTTAAQGQAKEPEPITEEFYEDMAPGTEGPQEDYVVMEPGEDIGGEELYVDVDTPTPARTTIAVPPKSIEREADKITNSPKVKSGTFSRMFKTKPPSPQLDRKAGHNGHSGTISHKAPKKSKFEERWAVVDGNFLIIYKNSSAKSHQEKLPLSECGLDMGSPDVGPGEHAFRITARGDRVHHFKHKAKLDFDKWVSIIKGLTKYAPIETVERGEQQVYQAQEDHIGESAGELTFKKGTYIRLISKDADNEWVGQIGNEAQVFEGKIGKFPMNKVSLAEDLYI